MKTILTLLCASVLSGQVAPPASAVLDQDAVHEIRLTFKQANWYEQLTADYAAARDNTPYREASLVWGQHRFDSVGVRFKGNSSYSGATTKKKPFRIKLNEFVKGQKIDDMASFGLSNGWSDPSFVREKAYYEAADKAGLAAPRSNFAALYINDEYWGLYILGEIVNGDFVDHHFARGDRDGNLYKAQNPGANLAYLGENPAAYQAFFSKESNEDADDWSDLIELARIFEQTPSSDLPGKLASLVDVDSFLTALALDNLTVNTDSYVGMAQNYYLYRRSSDNRWVWIPWDPSLAFGALGQGSSPDLPLEWTQGGGVGGGALPGGGGGGPGGGIGGGFGGGGRPIATKLWEVPQYKQQYREIYQQLVDRAFLPAEVIARMNSLRDMIRPWVEKDTQKLVTMAQFDAAMQGQSGTPAGPGTPTGPGNPGGPGGGGLGGGLGAPALEPFVEARAISVKAQLAGRPSPSLAATPSSLMFAQVSGASDAGSQEFALSLPEGSAATAFSATTTAPWVALTGATGTVPGRIGVRVSAPALAPGTHTGSISISAAGTTNSPLAVPVSLIVTPGPSIVASPASLTFSNFGGGGGLGQVPGAPTGLTQTVRILSTAGASLFAVAVSDSTCGNFLSVTPNAGITPATVTVTASAPSATGSCTARLNITSSGLAPATIPVTFNATTGPGGGGPGGFPGLPTIISIVNSASYASGSIAPGTIVTIFGTNLGGQNLTTGTFANGQMSTTVGGMQVTFDGTPAPILYMRADQSAVVVPFEVAGKTQVQVGVAMTFGGGGFPGGGQLPGGGQIPGGTQMTVAATAPGIYTAGSTGTGQAAIINESGTVNGASTPALRGSTVSIYLTGAGVLTPAGRTGGLGTADNRITAPVTVSIGGQEASVTYAGAAPSALQGLYQINAVVPSNVNAGSAPLLVTVGGVASQAGVTMTVQ